MTEKEIQLKVVEAQQDDAYKGIARIDAELMRELGIKRGDFIKIKGNRETVALADRAYPADVGEDIIRIDGIIRRNSKTGIGEVVKVSKLEIKEAKKVIIAPAQKNIMVQAEPEGLRRGLLGRALVKGDIVVLGGVQRRKDLLSDEFGGEFGDMLGDMLGNMGFSQLGGFTQIKFIVVSTNPSQPVYISENTEVILNPKAVEINEESVPEINYEDIGGLSDEIKKIREMVEIPLKHPEIFQKLGIDPPKGVLLHGPPGTGKTLLAKAVANESEANFILLNGPEIMSKFYGESEKKIRDIFEEAEKSAPAIIFIDEIDAIAPKREEVSGEVERRVVSQLLTMMDGLKSRGNVIVIGATNRVNSLDPALRRPGRFDREIEINVPGKEGRLSILKIHTRGMPLKNVKLVEIAAVTHGFVGADLESLAKEAAMNVLRKLLPKMNLDAEAQIPPEILDQLIIKQEDFMDALKVVRPSAMREVLVETPNVSWEQVGGLDKVKSELIEAVEWPLKNPEIFKRMGIKPPRGILLYGPPGTGKTLLAKAVAKESEANFIQVKGPSLLSMWVGKSEEGMRKVFERARQVSPCIIFFDEIDSLAGKRGSNPGGSRVTERVLNQMLAEMDGLEDLKDVLVIGATNRPDMLDPAVLRPGRFDKILLIGAPEEEGRLQILKIHTMNMPLDKSVDLKDIAKKAIGFTGADLEAFVREAALISLRESMDSKVVKKKHFDEALKKIKPSVSKPMLEVYKKIEDVFINSAKSAIPMENSYLG
ncbi:MAG: CDC48 family AAA ATPase [Nanoarchaeota archaeon]|nr:CDC48 family AAA ATPase [Nanoarchaeota archaeon]MBU1501721.1 CDC48 family AAA ATPase [Nanoarchaeota archaeon]MBU2459249.1 CDC48 family AAA ATPase [Nanoarchaeota archaeon]